MAPEEPQTATRGILLGSEDAAPYSIYDAADRDWLILCDHASNAFPAALGTMGLPQGAAELHIASDIGARAVARRLAQKLCAPLVVSNFSRLVIDCNRYPEATDAMPVESDGVAVPANADLSPAQRQARINEIFVPYHRAIAHMLDRAAADGRSPAVVSVHSCTDRMGGQSRPWHIGLGWARDARMGSALVTELSRVPGLTVGDNEPYAVDLGHDYTIPEHAMSRGLANILVEFRNDLVGDEAGVRRYADILHQALTACAADPAWHAAQFHLSPDDNIRGFAHGSGRTNP